MPTATSTGKREDASPRLTWDKINRTKISEATGIDLAHVSRIFSGKVYPSLRIARMIAVALGVTLDELADFLGIIVEKKE